MELGLLARLRSGMAVSDEEFDALLDDGIAVALSNKFWTPVDVAVRAAQLLAPTGDVRVLDVGSGVGKLCAIGAAITGARFSGIEQQGRLVEVAQRLVHRLGLADVELVHGPADAVPWQAFDAFYFFNPFFYPSYLLDVRHALLTLDALPPGTRVVTYHGLGAPLPSSYSLVHREAAGGDELCLWIRNPLSLRSAA